MQHSNMWPFNVETVPLPPGYQSPINVMTRHVKVVDMPPLNTKSYDQIRKYEEITCENNGHTIECSLKNITALPYIEGGPLPAKYIFSNIHWHWGKIDAAGSEHYLNGKTYAAEIHLVHFKQQYGTLEEAKNHQDGLCVFAFFATLSRFDNPDLDALFDDINTNLSVCYSSVNRPWHEMFGWVNNLLRNNQDWITYPGALTSSPYIETVTWIIFRKKFKISPDQLNQLRKLQKPDGQFNLEHRRGLFPLNKRPVLARTDLKTTKTTKLDISVTKSIELTPKLEIRL